MAGEIVSYEQALASGLPIREVQVVDALLPGLEDDVIKVNMVQRMTDSGRRVRFNVMACVGNRDGYVGLGMAKAKEVATAIRKAITAAKLNLISVQRGNGSWESSPGPGNTVPFKVNGRAASTRVTLMPAAKGKGLVIGQTGKSVLQLAGIEFAAEIKIRRLKRLPSQLVYLHPVDIVQVTSGGLNQVGRGIFGIDLFRALELGVFAPSHRQRHLTRR